MSVYEFVCGWGLACVCVCVSGMGGRELGVIALISRGIRPANLGPVCIHTVQGPGEGGPHLAYGHSLFHFCTVPVSHLCQY